MLENSGHISFHFDGQSVTIALTERGHGNPLVYLHGWGCDRAIFTSLQEALQDLGKHVLIDFPGFGSSSFPPSAWGTVEYMECLHRFLDKKQTIPCVFICHSFGGRVALRFAEKFSHQIKGLILISSAGIKKKVPLKKKLRVISTRSLARLCSKIIPGTIGQRIKQTLYNKIASSDYKNAGKLRPILVKIVNEDLSDLLPGITVPTLIINGSEDVDTPPEMGRRMAELIPNATFVELPGFGHLDILNRGRHQLEHQIRQFLKGLL